MEISANGLVDGGVEVAWVESGAVETQVVFNPVQWVRHQFLEIKDAQWKKREIGIGNENVFAVLEYGRGKFFVEYRHPKFLRTAGFLTAGMKEEFTDVQDAAESVVMHAMSVLP